MRNIILHCDIRLSRKEESHSSLRDSHITVMFVHILNSTDEESYMPNLKHFTVDDENCPYFQFQDMVYISMHF